MVGVILANFIRTVNMGGNMSAEQISQCANDIVEDFFFYSLDDIDLCFRLVRTGKLKLEKAPYRMDQIVIFEYLHAYDQARFKAKREMDQKQQDLNNIYDIMQSGPLNKILHEVTDKLKVKEERPVFVPKPRPNIEIELEKEFDELWIVQGKRTYTGWNIVDYKDRPMYVLEYKAARLVELLNESQTEQ